MNILFLTDGIYPFQLGGMQKHSLLLVKMLAKANQTIEVVHCGGKDYSSESFSALFTIEEQSKIQETYVKFPKTDPFPGHYIRENKAYSKNAYFELEDRIKTFDLIYAQGFTGWHFIKEKHRKQFNCPIFVNFHGLEMYQTAPSLMVMAEYTLLKNSVKWNLRNADYVYSFGGQIDRILTTLGIHENRVIQQSNGIERSWLNRQPKQVGAVKRFIFVGRAERRKGIEELTKVLTKLLKEEREFEFSFVGPIPDKLKILAPSISYLGEIRDPKELKEILDDHDCLVCPSHAEGMPTVILEAMACGLAIIGTDVGAVSRLISGNGILIEAPDPKLLMAAFDELINQNAEVWTAMKSKSVEKVENEFLWDRVGDQKLRQFEAAYSKSKEMSEAEAPNSSN